jgi:hypothetical protein
MILAELLLNSHRTLITEPAEWHSITQKVFFLLSRHLRSLLCCSDERWNYFILFTPCIVIRKHTTVTNKCTLIAPRYIIEYSHSELARHVSIPCWDHHQGLLDYKLHNYKLKLKVHVKRIRCIKVKIVGYLCWLLGPLEINVTNIKLNIDINIHKHSKLYKCKRNLCLCMFISIFNLIFVTLIYNGPRNQQR